MSAPLTSGRWRHHATLRTRGHVATVTRHEPSATYQAGPLYAVALNGHLKRSVPTWREAMAYATNLLTMQTTPNVETR